MISVSDALNEIISNYPFIEEGLSKGIVNYSAFAREIKPQIEKRLYKTVKEGAIVMALKRMSPKFAKSGKNNNLTDITVRSNLSEFTFQNSQTLLEKTRELFNSIGTKQDLLCTLSEGIRETTYIVSSVLANTIKELFKQEQLIANLNNLSSITIRLPKEVVYIPGVYYQILKKLAWENINVIEVLSTYTEITLIVETKNVDRAFALFAGEFALATSSDHPQSTPR